MGVLGQLLPLHVPRLDPRHAQVNHFRWVVLVDLFLPISHLFWQFMAISAYFCLLLAISTFYIFFDHVFLELIPSIHSTYHLPLLAINGIIFGLHYARY